MIFSYSCKFDTPKQIDYPGANNNSQFSYDGNGRNRLITETTAGSVTATRQFIWNIASRLEERDATSARINAVFSRGELIGSTKYFFSKDHLGSVRTATDISGAIQANLMYDSFGRESVISSSVNPTLHFGGYFNHERSGLALTVYRQYSSILARWITRDPIGRYAGFNQYSYVSNMPAQGVDSLGLFLQILGPLYNKLACICMNEDCVDLKDRKKCLEEAAKIASSMQNTANSMGSNPGSNQGGGNVDGYMCWDYAVAFHDTLNVLRQRGDVTLFRSQMRSWNQGDSTATHWATNIAAGGGGSPCSVNLDDGFMGGGSVHDGGWGSFAGWGENFGPEGQKVEDPRSAMQGGGSPVQGGVQPVIIPLSGL